MNTKSAYFWMDTLCVPPQQELSEYRQAAILSMKEVYEAASLVLVLNAELERTSIEPPTEEILMTISTNSWFRRLWTLQEGYLGRTIQFQFHDGTIDVEELAQRRPAELRRFSVQAQLRSEAMEAYRWLRAFSRYADTATYQAHFLSRSVAKY
jgi:hypothetical protein